MAYAVESLSMILKQVLNPYHQQYLILDHKLQIQSLLEKVNILKNYLTTTGIIDILERRIVIASQKGEDIIEAHMSDRILSSISTHLSDLKDLMEEFDSINEEILKEFDPPAVLLPHNLNSPLVVPSTSSPDPEPSLENILVGMEDRVDLLRDVITREQSQLQEIAIVGEGGMGKTTLARKLYNDSSVTDLFDTRLWITISMDSNLRDSLLSLLESLRKLTSRMHRESDDELGKHIYKALRGKRYLIMLDDIWQIEEWEILRRFFPDDGNGSRILLTTRLLPEYVVEYSTVVYDVDSLYEHASWELLCLKVFAWKRCPPELVEIGKRICVVCYGHPLMIIVIAGILLTSKTRHFWEFVLQNIISLSHRSILEVLNMGYNHLPHYLKPCFLYMGAFREDREIGASEIIRLWVADNSVKTVLSNLFPLLIRLR